MVNDPMTPTPEMIAMARRIAAHALCGPEGWKPGVKAGMFDDIMKGLADSEVLVLGPLTAIMEVTEAAANLAEGWNAAREDRVTEVSIAKAIRNGGHLR